MLDSAKQCDAKIGAGKKRAIKYWGSSVKQIGALARHRIMQRKGARSFTHICLAAQVNQAYLGKPGMWQNAEKRASFMHWNSLSLAKGFFISPQRFPTVLDEWIISQIKISGSP